MPYRSSSRSARASTRVCASVTQLRDSAHLRQATRGPASVGAAWIGVASLAIALTRPAHAQNCYWVPESACRLTTDAVIGIGDDAANALARLNVRGGGKQPVAIYAFTSNSYGGDAAILGSSNGGTFDDPAVGVRAYATGAAAVGLRATSEGGSEYSIGVRARAYGQGSAIGVESIVGSDDVQGRAVYGLASATSGTTYGLYGEVASPSGRAVYGRAGASSGSAVGVYGDSQSTSGFGVYGSSPQHGVFGYAFGASGHGVYGFAESPTGSTNGVIGSAASTSGRGVHGVASATTGAATGVLGESSSPAGYGVYGSSPNIGVIGLAHGAGRYGVYGGSEATSGHTYGVYGVAASPQGSGVYGLATAGASSAVYGENTSGIGYGVRGYAPYVGVLGTASSASGYGVYGANEKPDGYAGYFQGKGYFSGTLGVGTSAPAYTLHVNGSAGKPGGGSWSSTSDERLKRHVEPLERSLERLLALRGVSFEYRDPAAIGELPGRHVGVLAHEVERAFPDWVDAGADGYKRVTFRGFEALAVEALRELRAEKDAQLAALERSHELRIAELRAQHAAERAEQASAQAALEARLARIERALACVER